MCHKNMLTTADPVTLHVKSSVYERQTRHYADDKNDDTPSRKWQLTGLRGIAGKYKIFQDYDSPIILDVDEERELRRTNPEQLEEIVTKIDPYAEMNLEREYAKCE